MRKPWTLFLVLATVMMYALPALGANPSVRPVAGAKGEPLARLAELLNWLAVEQHPNGGWAHKGVMPLRYHLHEERPPAKRPKLPPHNAFDTGMAALALVRGGNTLERGAHAKDLLEAAEYLYGAVMSSPDGRVGIESEERATPFTDRIGPHADAFAAMIFFAELRTRSRDADGGLAPSWVRYEQATEKLIHKITTGLHADGSWGDGAAHAPLLGHALGVWALEAASREGMAVDPKLVTRAGQYAMSKEAEQREFKTNGRWKKSTRQGRKRRMRNELLDDDEPVMHETYLMAARLNVLYQADRTNRQMLAAATARAKAGGASAARLADLTAMTRAANATREALSKARDAIRRSWSKAHPRDVHPSPAPMLFTGEDFLASLLTVDAMAAAGDVEQWFTPVVQKLMTLQDPDGGLRIQEPITCGSGRCPCKEAGPDLANVLRGDRRPLRAPKIDEFAFEPQNCPAQKSWCSRDRVFITSAGVAILLADTPYRPAFVGLVKP